MITTECPPTESLAQLSSGRIGSTEDENALWDHVRDCVDCQANLDSLSDADDSLIGSLRNPDGESPFQNESTCRSAILKALGALAGTGEGEADDADRDASGLAGDLLAKEPWPRSIGEYEIVRLLGRGGMGSVFLARHTKLGRQVALKLLGGYRLADPRMRQRFDAEMRAIGRLSHPNVVTAHDARDIDGTAVLITEFIDGLDLAQLVSRTGPLAIADACEVIRQVAVALAYVNEQGFVHRDVKPSNIMLGRGGEVKLLDLGLARFLGSDESAAMTGTGQTMGTADFIAPEQVTDSRSVDIRADIYSLGCTLFHLLTGSAPFADEAHTTSFAKLTAHVSEPPPKLSQRLSTASAPLVQLIDTMLAKQPDRRPATPTNIAEQLAGLADGHDLRRLADRGITAPPADTAPAIAPRSSQAVVQPWMRRPVPRSLAIASGLIGILFGFVLGIIVTITLPDGSKMTVNLPQGSDIAIDYGRPEASAVGRADRPSGNMDGMGGYGGMMDAGPMGDMGMSGRMGPDDFGGEMMGGEMGMEGGMYGMGGGDMSMGMTDMGGMTESPDEMGSNSVSQSAASPLAFAILLEPDAISADQLQQKERMTRLGMHPATGNEFGSWYEVADDVDVPFEFAIDGKRYTLVGAGQDARIRWEELQSMVELEVDPTPEPSDRPEDATFMAVPESSIRFTFKETLPERMRFITSKHIGKQLAVIVDGVIVSAPRIRSEISSAASLTGNFRPADLEKLRAALDRRTGRSSAIPASVLKVDTTGLTAIQGQLKTIGVAFHQFHDTFGKLPRSTNLYGYGLNQNAPPHPFSWPYAPHPFSWRVAILPLLGERELYQRYRFDEPWDSEHNLTLLPLMPEIYRSPTAAPTANQTPEGETHFQGLVGQRTALGASFRDITDGTSNTLLIVESLDSVPWTKPADIPFENELDLPRIQPRPGHPLHFLMVDGSVRKMETIDPTNLMWMILRDDGQTVRFE